MAKNIKNIVNAITKEHGTRNPFEIAENLGIYVHRGSLGNIHGCYLLTASMHMQTKLIMINSDSNNNLLQKFIMAHELGHAIMHEDNECYLYNKNSLFLKSKTEIEAHRFAAELLITDEYIMEHPGMTKRQLSQMSGYSMDIMNYKQL